MYTNGMSGSNNYRHPGTRGRSNRAQRRAEGRTSRVAVKESPPRTLYKEVLLLLAAITSVLLFVAPAIAEDGVAKLRMVHLSPDAPEVMVTLDGQPVEALANVSYKDASPYLEIPAGPHEIAVYATADASTPVLEVEVAPEAGSSYTIAGMGLLADGTFGAKLFEDDNEAPEDGKFKVRVIHAIPDVGPATVSVAGGPDLFALPGFTNASGYAEADPGTYTFDVTPAGADTPAFSVPDVTAQEGKVYTAFAIGKAADGTVGTIITDDSNNGEVILTQGGGGESEAPASKIHPQEIQNPVSAPRIEADLEKAQQEEAAEKEAKEKEAAQEEASEKKTSEKKADERETAEAGKQSVPTLRETAPVQKPAPVQKAAPAQEVAQVEGPAPAQPETVYVEEVPAQAAPVVEAAPVPETVPVAPSVEVPAEVPQVDVPQVNVDAGYVPEVHVPEVAVPDVSGIVSGVTQGVYSSTDVATSGGATVTSINEVTGQPVTDLPDANYIVDQTLDQVGASVPPVTSGYVPPTPDPYVPQAPDVPISEVPVNPAINQTVTVVNSGPRRKFVSIRKDAGEGSE